MEQGSNSFFPGTSRRVIIGSPTKQASNGRIVFGIRMPLTGESLVGMPDWVGEAYEAVSKYLSEASPEVQQVADLTLAFSNDKPTGELFAHPSAKVPGAELKNFSVVRAGEADDPDVELQFKAFTPYTRDFWGWIGDMAGGEVYMAFPSSIAKAVTVAAAPVQVTIDEVVSAAETEAFAGDTKPDDEYEQQVREAMGAPEPLSEAPRLVRHDDPEPKANGKGKGKKNGPAELKKYHEQEVAAGRVN